MEPLRYLVDLADRDHHLVRVTLSLPAEVAGGARISFATWTPGSYVLRHYARHVQWIRATDAHGTLQLEPSGLGAWRLPRDAGAAEIAVELYANDLTVRTNHVDDHHALIIPAATFPFVETARDRPHEVTFAGVGDHVVYSLLAQDATGTFVADNLDHLIDSAFEVGDLPTQTFAVDEIPHTFVWAGHGPTPDLERIAADITAIAQESVKICDDGFPINRYVLLCVGWDTGAGGLEHRDGAVVQVPVHTFGDDDRYSRFLALVAHEYFHIWNVKRLTPAALVRPDFTKPTLTSSLWLAEGWTAYYDELLPTRAHCWTAQQFVTHLGEMLRGVNDMPATQVQPLHAASHDAWIKHYIRDENSINAATDYYNHGAAVACELDLRLRATSQGQASLDTVFRLLWQRHAGTDTGYTEDDVSAAIATVGGDDLAAHIRDRVAAAAPPHIDDALLNVVGLRWESTPSQTPDLGVHIREDDTGITLTAVLRDRPAWRAGLTGGDRVVAIDKTTIQRGELDAALRSSDGQSVSITVARGPRLLTREVRLGQPRDRMRIVPVDDPSSDAQAAFTAWTGHSLSDVT